MTDITNQGSCLCGQVIFEVRGDFENFFLCYCKYCQKDTGSAHAANLFSSHVKIKWLKGSETVKTFNLPATRHVKSFCAHCGSALPSEQRELNLIIVPAGSLDSEIAIKPKARIFTASQANWCEKLETIRAFEKFPD